MLDLPWSGPQRTGARAVDCGAVAELHCPPDVRYSEWRAQRPVGTVDEGNRGAHKRGGHGGNCGVHGVAHAVVTDLCRGSFTRPAVPSNINSQTPLALPEGFGK